MNSFVTPVKQYNEFACFPACLESCIRDFGESFSHEDFVKQNLDLFHGGESIEGATDLDIIDKVCARAGYQIEVVDGQYDLEYQKIIFLIHCNADPRQQHIVRFAGSYQSGESTICRIMDPMQPMSPIDIPIGWVRAIYEIRPVADEQQR